MILALIQALLRAAGPILVRQGQARILSAAERRLLDLARRKISRKVVETAKEILREVERSEADNAYHALIIAKTLSSGRLSRADLVRMGHPYRIGGRPPGDPAIVNLQTGAFFRGWKVEGPRAQGGDLQTNLVNVAPHAEFLFQGTSRMIARPILQRIDLLVAARRTQNFRGAIVTALLKSR